MNERPAKPNTILTFFLSGALMPAKVLQYTYMQPLCIKQSHAQCARISECLYLTADLIQAL